MQCTHQLSHTSKYRRFSRCDVDFTNMTKLLVSSYNRSDIARIQRSLHSKARVFDFLHFRLRTRFWKKQTLDRLFISSIFANWLQINFFINCNDFDFNYFAWVCIRHQSTDISIHIESLIETNRYFDQKFKTLSNFFISINLFQNFWVSNIFKWFIISFTRKYHDSYFAIKFRIEIRKFFYSVFVLITNEHRMHVQKSAKKNVYSSYKMTRYLYLFQLF